MIDWRLVIATGLATATMAASVAYLMAPPWQTEAIQPSPPIPAAAKESAGPTENAKPPGAEEKALADFEAAADAILRKAPDSRASTSTQAPAHAARIPLPRRRPASAP